jgi:TRAP-type C4-dicarboxylate transport system permease small subunit
LKKHLEGVEVTFTSTEGAFARLARIVVGIACVALVCMTLVEAWQVFARYVLNDSPSWTEPVGLLLMSTAMMFGAAVGVRSQAHFGFFLALHVTPPRIQRLLVATGRVVIVATGAMLAFWGGELLVDGWDVRMAGAPLPQGLFFLPICLGGGLIAVFALEQLLHSSPTAAGEVHSALESEA